MARATGSTRAAGVKPRLLTEPTTQPTLDPVGPQVPSRARRRVGLLRARRVAPGALPWTRGQARSRQVVPSYTATVVPFCSAIDIERSFAHNLDRVGIRRTWLRGRENVHKRYLLHVAGHNLSLLMRQLIGAGTPKEAVAGGIGALFVLVTPAGAVLVVQIVLIVSEDGETAFAAICFAVA